MFGHLKSICCQKDSHNYFLGLNNQETILDLFFLLGTKCQSQIILTQDIIKNEEKINDQQHPAAPTTTTLPGSDSNPICHQTMKIVSNLGSVQDLVYLMSNLLNSAHIPLSTTTKINVTVKDDGKEFEENDETDENDKNNKNEKVKENEKEKETNNECDNISTKLQHCDLKQREKEKEKEEEEEISKTSIKGKDILGKEDRFEEYCERIVNEITDNLNSISQSKMFCDIINDELKNYIIFCKLWRIKHCLFEIFNAVFYKNCQMITDNGEPIGILMKQKLKLHLLQYKSIINFLNLFEFCFSKTQEKEKEKEKEKETEKEKEFLTIGGMELNLMSNKNECIRNEWIMAMQILSKFMLKFDNFSREFENSQRTIRNDVVLGPTKTFLQYYSATQWVCFPLPLPLHVCVFA